MAQKITRTSVVAKVTGVRTYKEEGQIRSEEFYNELFGCETREKIEVALSKIYRGELITVREIEYSLMTRSIPLSLFEELSTLEKEVELSEEEMVARVNSRKRAK